MRVMTEKRIEALESKGAGANGLRLIVVEYVEPRDWEFIGPLKEREPIGVKASPPHFPVMDREPGESWDAFTTRLAVMIPLDGSVALAHARYA